VKHGSPPTSNGIAAEIGQLAGKTDPVSTGSATGSPASSVSGTTTSPNMSVDVTRTTGVIDETSTDTLAVHTVAGHRRIIQLEA
jgi:hypothetical protein